MSYISEGRESPIDELQLILRAFEGLGVLSDSSCYEGELVGALIRQLNKRFADELARLGSESKVVTLPSLRPV